jgi:hypothetical protein
MTVFKVEIQSFDQLTDAEKDEWGGSDDYSNYLRVTHDDKTVLLTRDSMEPEDVRFTRDLAWVPLAIKQAYDLGKADAAK